MLKHWACVRRHVRVILVRQEQMLAVYHQVARNWLILVHAYMILCVYVCMSYIYSKCIRTYVRMYECMYASVYLYTRTHTHINLTFMHA